jgi:hypothetical protein
VGLLNLQRIILWQWQNSINQLMPQQQESALVKKPTGLICP